MTEPHRDGETALQDRDSSVESALGTIASPTVSELSHSQVRERLSDYLDGSLAERDANVVRSHLDVCPSCRAFRETLRQTVDLLGTAPAPQAPSRAKQRLLDRVQAAHVRR